MHQFLIVILKQLLMKARDWLFRLTNMSPIFLYPTDKKIIHREKNGIRAGIKEGTSIISHVNQEYFSRMTGRKWYKPWNKLNAVEA